MCLNSSKCMTHFVSILSETIVENNVAFKCASWKISVDALHTSAYNNCVVSLSESYHNERIYWIFPQILTILLL